MAPVRFSAIKPYSFLSQRASPPALTQALLTIFRSAPQDLWLVGGAALSGFYAEHRRSDDLDLFAGSERTLGDTAQTIKTLAKKGALLSHERRTPNFYHTDVHFLDHPFTIDVVLDENLHRVGQAYLTKQGIRVATPRTLFATKAACLVSRCSEKDLYDLMWFFGQEPDLTVKEVLEAGQSIDGGMNVETLLISLQGSLLRKEACEFLLKNTSLTPAQVFQKIVEFKKTITRALLEHEKNQDPSVEVKILRKVVRGKI